MKLKKGQKLLFIGDSVTDCDRIKPAGEGRNGGLGHGYVANIDSLLQSVYPELLIRVINKGISGNNVRDLKVRWQEDVLDQKPNWLVIMIGINDVWRQFDTPFNNERHVYIEEYKETLTKLVQETTPLVEGIVLMTPFFIENKTQDPMRQKMDQYGEVVKQLALDNNCLFIDTQEAFNKVLQELHSSALAWDRIHPNPTGHMILTRAFLQEIDFDWNKW